MEQGSTERSLDRVLEIKHVLETKLTGDTSISVLERAADRLPGDDFVKSLINRPLREITPLLFSRYPDVVRSAASSLPLLSLPARISAHGADQQAAPSIAVGYRMLGDGAFKIIVRLQNANPATVMETKTLAAEHGASEVSIGIVDELVTHGGDAQPGPLRLGMSVGVQGGFSGSVGGFVKTRAGKAGLVSCSHILARGGKGQKGDAVLHPYPGDGEGREIGTLAEFEDMRKRGARPWDAAMALIGSAPGPVRNVIPDGFGYPGQGRAIGAPSSARPVRAQKVAKMGSASEWTDGQVTAYDLGPLDVWFPVLNKYVKITGMTEIAWAALDKPFSREGDSGALVFGVESSDAFGLVVGGGEITVENEVVGRSYVCPLRPVLDSWSLQWG